MLKQVLSPSQKKRWMMYLQLRLRGENDERIEIQ
jgi:hypothetical protein